MTIPVDIHYMGATTQRTGVTRAYTIDVSDVGTPTSPSGSLYAHTDWGTDLAATKLTGSASVSGTDITTEQLTALAEGTWYRYTCTYTVSGNTEMDYFDVYCTDNEVS